MPVYSFTLFIFFFPVIDRLDKAGLRRERIDLADTERQHAGLKQKSPLPGHGQTAGQKFQRHPFLN
jgi:hypothetical protein